MTGADLKNFFGSLRRHPLSVACVILALAGAGSAAYFWQDAGSITDLHSETDKKFKEMLDVQRGATALRAELGHVKEYTKRIDEYLLVEDDVGDNKRYFYALAAQNGADLPICEQGKAPPLEEGQNYRKIPFNIKVTGDYEKVAGFLQALETGPRLTAITSFAIRRMGGDTSNLAMLDLTIDQLGKK